jgi:hypothetical protein
MISTTLNSLGITVIQHLLGDYSANNGTFVILLAALAVVRLLKYRHLNLQPSAFAFASQK